MLSETCLGLLLSIQCSVSPPVQLERNIQVDFPLWDRTLKKNLNNLVMFYSWQCCLYYPNLPDEILPPPRCIIVAISKHICSIICKILQTCKMQTVLLFWKEYSQPFGKCQTYLSPNYFLFFTKISSTLIFPVSHGVLPLFFHTVRF